MAQGVQKMEPRDQVRLHALRSTRSSRRALGAIDLAVAVVLALSAGLAFAFLPDGSVLRVALGLAMVFLVPGYLLIEAAAPVTSEPRRRMLRICLAVGVSPVVLGLLALATAALPGGFHSASIVGLSSLVCVAAAAVAFLRRRSSATSDARLPAASSTA
ncbi:MAG: hypothetical protein QOJ26_1468 [Thermoplasmata archaeon]|nr:hypothetical protein [Thermoplasmata archaeon]